MSTNTSQPSIRPAMVVLGIGMAVVGTVWALSCWWSFAEQTRAAESLHFRHPGVLPWMLDALAVALALVALASALTGQAATAARFGVLLALAGSVWANTQGVSLRYGGHPQQDALIMAAIAPLSAFIALEVILGRIRRLVLWLRGEPAPAAIPALRLVRLLLAPRTSFSEWRSAVLDRTAPTKPAVSGPAGTAGDTVRPADGAVSGHPAPQLRSALGAHPDLAEGSPLPTGVAAGRERAASDGRSSSSPAPVPASTPTPLGVEATTGREGAVVLAPAPPARSLTAVSVDRQDTRPRTASSAAGHPARPVVSARADSTPGHRQDTRPGHPEDTSDGHREDTRTDTQDTPASDSVLTPATDTPQDTDLRYAAVSAALLSGLSVRRTAAQLSVPKSYVEKVSRDLAAGRQATPAEGRQ